MLPLLSLVLACAFVEPEEVVVIPTLPAIEAVEVDATRQALLATDGGAELWRSLDAHGTLGRWRLLGPPTVTLDDGSVLAAGDPRLRALFAPFTSLPVDGAPTPSGEDPIYLAMGDHELVLDEASRRVIGLEDERGRWKLSDHRAVERMTLPHRLVTPDGTEVRIARYAFAEPPSR